MTQKARNEAEVLEILKQVKYPGYSRDIVSFGMVRDIHIENTKLTVQLAMQGVEERMSEGIKEFALQALRLESGFENVQVDAEVVAPPQTEEQSEQPRRSDDMVDPQPMAGIDSIIAVSSGKGGVGKSTVAVNLAVSAAKQGKKVGLLDADIHGPSLPTLMGIKEQPQGRDNKILPFEKHGIKSMSIGYLIDANQPLIWRGPMLNKALEQIITDTIWGKLDILFFDLPPGTGDVQISLAQKYKLDGAVVVTTPQNLALADVTRGAVMFQHTNVPVLGIVENMSYYRCPNCGDVSHPFGEGGGTAEAAKLGLPLLGRLPMEPKILELSDRGEPVVLAEPESESAKNYQELWENLQKRLVEMGQ
jgi:ATP-binding protein involved in chromosome partitioning